MASALNMIWQKRASQEKNKTDFILCAQCIIDVRKRNGNRINTCISNSPILYTYEHFFVLFFFFFFLNFVKLVSVLKNKSEILV